MIMRLGGLACHTSFVDRNGLNGRVRCDCYRRLVSGRSLSRLAAVERVINFRVRRDALHRELHQLTKSPAAVADDRHRDKRVLVASKEWIISGFIRNRNGLEIKHSAVHNSSLADVIRANRVSIELYSFKIGILSIRTRGFQSK